MRVLLYRCPGPHAGTPVDGKGTTYDARGVEPEAVAAAKADGWYETLPEAAERFVRGAPLDPVREAAENDEPSKAAPVVADAPVAVDDLRALDIDALKAMAKDLPDYDGRLGKEKLVMLIEKARG
jgi:hypothetical protein